MVRRAVPIADDSSHVHVQRLTTTYRHQRELKMANIFYALGSVCFLIGTIINMVRSS